METINDYELTTLYIKAQEDRIAEFARGFLLGASEEDKADGDIWHAWGDRVDLNFYKSANGRWKCFAYPVVNGDVNCSEQYEVAITINTQKGKS